MKLFRRIKEWRDRRFMKRLMRVLQTNGINFQTDMNSNNSHAPIEKTEGSKIEDLPFTSEGVVKASPFIRRK